jgi:hypothetical protein
MQEKNKTIWEIPPREPIPRKDTPDHGPEHPERQSEGNTQTRHASGSRGHKAKRSSMDK